MYCFVSCKEHVWFLVMICSWCSLNLSSIDLIWIPAGLCEMQRKKRVNIICSLSTYLPPSLLFLKAVVNDNIGGLLWLDLTRVKSLLAQARFSSSVYVLFFSRCQCHIPFLFKHGIVSQGFRPLQPYQVTSIDLLPRGRTLTRQSVSSTFIVQSLLQYDHTV